MVKKEIQDIAETDCVDIPARHIRLLAEHVKLKRDIADRFFASVRILTDGLDAETTMTEHAMLADGYRHVYNSVIFELNEKIADIASDIADSIGK